MAILILSAHLVWIGFVIFGTLWTRRRPGWTALHILALLWGIVVEVSPWPCPLTAAENYFEVRAGTMPHQGGFLLHYLDSIVYPNLPDWALTLAGITVCAVNLAVYCLRLRSFMNQRSSSTNR